MVPRRLILLSLALSDGDAGTARIFCYIFVLGECSVSLFSDWNTSRKRCLEGSTWRHWIWPIARKERRRVRQGVGCKATEAFVECLLAEGVEVIFGYPGGAVLPIYDSLYDGKIRHILVRHEQGAAHMADGYARATGKPGVCLATSGPGATNLVTGLATRLDGLDSRWSCFTGNVSRSAIGTDAFQEADITGITLPDHQAQLSGAERQGSAPRIKEASTSRRRAGPVRSWSTCPRT